MKIIRKILGGLILLSLLPFAGHAQFVYNIDYTNQTANFIGYDGTNRDVIIPSTVAIVTNEITDDVTNEVTNYFPVTSIGNGVDSVFGTTVTSVSIPDSVTSITNYAFASCDSLANVAIPYGVTRIGNGAFQYCGSLINVTIPDSVQSMGTYAFFNCTNLNEVTIGDGLISIEDFTFSACYRLENITIGEGVTSIGPLAFSSYINEQGLTQGDGLTSVTIPDSVISIGNLAFASCPDLASVTIGDGVTSIGTGAFEYCASLNSVELPDGVTSIANSTFAYCYALANVGIPDSVTSIGTNAFYLCQGLTSVTIPDSVTDIQDFAFYECQHLSDLTLGNGVTDIQDYAFASCESLANFTIPDNVASIGNGTFAECTSLTSVDIPTSVTSVGNGAFANCFGVLNVSIAEGVTNLGANAFGYCDQLTSVVVPESVTSLNGTFANCFDLTNIVIPDSINNIGDYTFQNCSYLGNIEIPEAVTNIGTSAFENCGLSSVVIPGNVASIGYGAFQMCGDLTNVCFEGNAPTDGGQIFSGSPATLNYIDGSTGWGPTFSGINTTPCTQCNGSTPLLTITPYRLAFQQTTVQPTDSVDAPIVPTNSFNVLTNVSTPLGLGVVADGVTPVLFNITGLPGNYSLAFGPNSAGWLSTNLFILQNGTWNNTTNFSITAPDDAGSGTTFAYLQGLNWTNLAGLSSSHDVPVTLNVIPEGASSAITNTSFRIRPPPIILVHGYSSDSQTWSSSFLATLGKNIPADFVQALNYGVSTDVFEYSDEVGIYTTTSINLTKNTSGFLNELARLLDVQLDKTFALYQANWACTRYDVVGHSQGGVLLRMLCQTNLSGASAFGASRPPVSTNDFYRGRFRRVITIGSPHNGTPIIRYVMDRANGGAVIDAGLKFFTDVLQEKFNPFGTQITYANNTNLYPIDARMKFVCIQAAVTNMNSFLFRNNDVYLYPVGPLCVYPNGANLPIGQLLLPNGSDRIVDFPSQGGGVGTIDAPYSAAEVTHADAPGSTQFIFGVPNQQTETGYAPIAALVNQLLAGPNSSFGPFVVPQLLPSSEECLIDSLAENSLTQDRVAAAKLALAAILLLPTGETARSNDSRAQTGGSSPAGNSCFDYSISLPSGAALGGNVIWEATVYGTNGMETYFSEVPTNEITFQTSGTDDTAVTVCLDPEIVGTVVLDAILTATNGAFYTTAPVTIMSNPPGNLVGMTLIPNQLSPGIGESQSFQLWGEYDSGNIAQLYLPPGANAVWSSSNPAVYAVDTNGVGLALTNGTATVNATYLGFTAQASVTVNPDGYVIAVDQPQSQIINQGQSAVLSASASGSGTLSYQWYFDNAPISGATNAILVIGDVLPANVGTYYVVINNGFSSATSSVASLSIPTPVITSELTNQVVLQGGNATFTIAAQGAPPLAYYWTENGTNVLADGGNISGSATSSLTISNVSVAESGTFLVTVSNLAGVASSSGAILTVIVPPTIYAFSGPDGANPFGGLIEGVDGNFYGTTSIDGTNGYGTVFEITSNGVLNTIASFDGNTGANPFASLVQARNGIFYGTTSYGGCDYDGNVFKITTDGVLAKVFSFNGTNGTGPQAALVPGNDGDYYGTTTFGGSYGVANGGYGTIFKITTNGALTTLVDFNFTNGVNPFGGLVLGQDGNFYGTTASGGTNDVATGGDGTVYKLGANGTLTTLFSFNFTNGAGPGALIQGSDGALYGTTTAGGTNDVALGGDGTCFKITTNGVFSDLASFNLANGANPNAGLIQATDGNFYGTTVFGGGTNIDEDFVSTNIGFGAVFELRTNGTITDLVSFSQDNGANPVAALVQGSDGALYGTTAYGGAANDGTVFRFSLASAAAFTVQAALQSNGLIVLTWNSVPGQSYQLQYTTSLTQPNWNNLTQITASGLTTSASWSVAPEPQRFYRVVQLP